MDAKSAISLSSRSTRPLSDFPLMQYWTCLMPCTDGDGPPHQLDDVGSDGLRCAVAIRSRFSGLGLKLFARHRELARGSGSDRVPARIGQNNESSHTGPAPRSRDEKTI